MADVTAFERRTSGTGRPERDRGQLVLLSGLLLATTLVALVLILNSAIYTENLATRNDGVPTTDAIEYRENAQLGVAGAIEYVNRHARSRDRGDHRNALNESIANWTNRSHQHVALDGHAANVTLNRSSTIEWGIRLGQNGNRNFTNKDGNASWRLAGNVSDPVQFRMNVNRSNLTAEGESGRFTVLFLNNSTNATVEEIYINQESGSQIRIENSSEFFCDVSGPRTVIDFVDNSTQNTTTGERTPCSALGFLDNIEGRYDIRFANAENVSGVYELSFDKGPDVVHVPDNYDTDGDPYASWAIREATVNVEYESASLRYESNVTVSPHDPGTIRPTEGTG